MKEMVKTFFKQYSQWLTPILWFVIAVGIFFVIFLNHTMDDAHDRAQNDIVADALVLERRVEVRLAAMRATVGMMTEQLSARDGVSDERTTETIAAVKNGAGYDAFALSGNGMAVNSEGETVECSSLPWYEKVRELTDGQGLIFHVENDGISDEEAVGCAQGFVWADGTQGVCLCFDNGWPEVLLRTGRGKSLMTIVDLDGSILMRSSVTDYFVRGENYWSLIGDDIASVARNHINRGDSYAVFDATNSYTVIEIPITGVKWAACISVSKNYISQLTNRYFQNTRKLLIELLISVIIFFALVIIINIVNKAKRLKESAALGAKADQDALTGLRNKAATERDIQEYMTQNPLTQSILFILDIDDFKSVNDTMGHSFGDDVLHEFGFGLSSMFRASDVAGRIGGDEFMVFVKNIPNEDTIEKEAKKVRAFIESFRAGDNVKRQITASAGAAVFPHDGKDFATLYKSADRALYQSKRNGKRQLSFFHK